ncbi:MAG: J domain-containing protein [Candidatus Limnocylindria bacterium]
MSFADPYATLGVDPGASDAEVRQGYARQMIRLQAVDAPASQIEAVKSAFNVLSDPGARAAYDETQGVVSATALDVGIAPEVQREIARGQAIRGGLWLAGGGVVTAATYAATPPGGTYFLAWGPVLFGGFQFLRGISAYLGADGTTSRVRDLLPVLLLAVVGLGSAGYVGLSESGAIGPSATVAEWNQAVDRADAKIAEATVLMTAVFERTGAWSAQDSTDMSRVASLYAEAAAIVETAPTSATLAWYQQGIVGNYRTAVAIARELASISSATTEAQFQSMLDRWDANGRVFDELNARYERETSAR